MGRNRKPIDESAQRSATFGKAKTGRPAGFREEYINLVETLVRDHDYTDLQIAELLEKNPSTIWRWKVQVPEFGKAFQRGEDAQVRVLEATALQKAMGFTYKAVKIFPPRVVVRKTKGKTTTIETKPIIVPYDEYYPPDMAAIRMLLEKHRPADYVPRMRHVGDPKAPVQFLMVGRQPSEEG